MSHVTLHTQRHRRRYSFRDAHPGTALAEAADLYRWLPCSSRGRSFSLDPLGYAPAPAQLGTPARRPPATALLRACGPGAFY